MAEKREDPKDDPEFLATLKRMLQTPHKLHKDEAPHKRQPKKPKQRKAKP